MALIRRTNNQNSSIGAVSRLEMPEKARQTSVLEFHMWLILTVIPAQAEI